MTPDPDAITEAEIDAHMDSVDRLIDGLGDLFAGESAFDCLSAMAAVLGGMIACDGSNDDEQIADFVTMVREGIEDGRKGMAH